MLIDYLKRIEDINYCKVLYLDLLGFDVSDKANENHHISLAFKRLISSTNDPALFRSELQYSHIELLIQVNAIKEWNVQDFEYYKHELVKAKKLDFFGQKFEIYIYNSLLEKKVKFSKPLKKPDFQIETELSPIYIECGSVQTENILTSDRIKNKLRRGISKKLKKEYSNMNTALFLNITNLLYSINEYNHEINMDELYSVALNEFSIAKHNFGALCLFHSKIVNPSDVDYAGVSWEHNGFFIQIVIPV